jgi:signal transduction histidine kinase
MYFFIGQQNYQDAVKAVGEIIKIGDYCFAVQEGNSELLAEINASLAIVKENGEYQQIFSDWFDTQMGVKFDINSLYPFIFGGFGFLGALGIYIFVLRRQIAQKSKELEKTQEIILQREKSEALGYLAGGIAHDFNNILTAIIGNISLLELEVKSGSEMEVISKDISMAANKGKSLANRLLTFAKGGTPIKEMVDLNKIIADTSKIALIGSSAKINTEKCQKCPSLKLDKAQISQVFQNIILNANQAMNSQGTITISSNIVRLEHNNQYGLKHKEYIKISISDSGSGISSENMLKIFDPYFSTKSKGTGLGLSTSFSIMKKHGGTITIDSIEGKGATFHLFFPNI